MKNLMILLLTVMVSDAIEIQADDGGICKEIAEACNANFLDL